MSPAAPTAGAYLSGRFDRPARPVTRSVFTGNVKVTLNDHDAAQALALILAEHPDYGGLQEWPKGRDHLIRKTADYRSIRSNKGGGPVVYSHTKGYRPASVRAVVLSRRGLMGHLPGRRNTLPTNRATLAVLFDDLGREHAVLNFHLTAEVQYAGRYRTDKAHRPRVRRHKREVRALRRVARRQLRKGRVFTAVGDSNYDGLTIPGLVSCWEDRNGGTLGGRAVDLIFAATEARFVRTIPTPSDHDAVVAVYR